MWRVSETKSWAIGLQQRLLIWRNVFWATNRNVWVSNTQSLPQRVQKMHFLNYSDHKTFCLSSFTPRCINELSNEKANGEELCLHPAAALCSWMFGTAPNPPFSPVTFFVILSFFFTPSLCIEMSQTAKAFWKQSSSQPWVAPPSSEHSWLSIPFHMVIPPRN